MDTSVYGSVPLSRENISNAFGTFDVALYRSQALFRSRFAPLDGAVVFDQH
jgi:hypothetical protein